MEKLKELVFAASKHKIKRIDIVGEQRSNSLVQRFYHGIHADKFKTDADAAMALYQSTADDINYKHLKYKLENRLINTLFFIDTSNPDLNEIQKAYYVCNKNLGAIAILKGRGLRKSAISLSLKTIRKSVKYEFTEITLSIARTLKKHYAYLEKNKKKFEYYSKLAKETYALLEVEMLANEIHEYIMFHAAGNRRGSSEDILEEVINYERVLKKQLQNFDSYNLRMLSYNIFCLRYEIIEDYKNVIKTSKEALTYFQSKGGDSSPNSMLVYYGKLITANISLKNYNVATSWNKKRMNLLVHMEGSRNWAITYELQLVLFFHQKKYNEAITTLTTLTQHKLFGSLQRDTQEIWKIYEAYVHYFILVKKIEISDEVQKSLKKFRLNKFLNNVPIFSKDKEGLNISILILQVLFLLKKGNYDKIIDRMEALERYCYKYLKKDSTYRSKCFIKMLIILIKSSFHKEATIRKTKVYLDKLKDESADISPSSSQVEVVPYEDLWQEVINSLDNKFVVIRKRKKK